MKICDQKDDKKNLTYWGGKYREVAEMQRLTAAWRYRVGSERYRVKKGNNVFWRGGTWWGRGGTGLGQGSIELQQESK